jgi:lysophospholipase L1-like esterase
MGDRNDSITVRCEEGESVSSGRFAKFAPRPARRGAALIAALVLGAVALLSSCQPVPIFSMASTGDSIARGFDACGFFKDCPNVSYSTGSDPVSNSLYQRLLPSNRGLAGHSYNDAEVGAQAIDLYGQMGLAIWQKADVVTVLIGANDACASTVGDMTSVDSFANSVQSAFALFFGSRPGARVVLSSIPNVYRLWQVAHNNKQAQMIWKLGQICPSMLSNPTSMTAGDQLRRSFVTLQISKYNAVLASICKQYSGCRWDGGALWRYPFALSQLSPYDYFHPNPLGQRAMSGLLWTTYHSGKD